jgi:hypothetical protein
VNFISIFNNFSHNIFFMQKQLRSKGPTYWSGLAGRLKRLAGKSALGTGILMAGWLSASDVKAQTIINNYTFAASSGTYTPLGATATQLPLVKADSYLSPSIPIGFTFNFDGVDYTNLKVSSNGFISFNTTNTSSENTNALSSSTARPLIAPLWDDLDGNAGTTAPSNASYELTGTSGSQVLTFEWRNWEWNWNSADAVVSFQVKLYEGSNKIEFIYNPEADAINNGSASVGIAGVGTGAGNFISFNNLGASPTADYTSETTTIATKPAAGQIYTFTKVTPATDVTVTGLSGLATTGCFGPNQTIKFTVKNLGSGTLDFTTKPLTVTSAVTGTNATTFPAAVINTGTLAAGASMDVTVSTTYNMSTAGTYTFTASATTPGEVQTANDALLTPATRTVTATAAAAPVALPQNVSFTGFTGANLATVFPGWTEATGSTVPSGTTSAWVNKSDLGTTGNVTAKVNLAAASKREWIVGPKITPTATTALLFKAAVTNKDLLTAPANGGMAGTDDQVQVMVSTDCGVTYTPIYTINGATGLTNVLTNQFVSLSAYAGQNIIVAFQASEGTIDDTPDYDFHIDDISIETPSANVNLGATAFVTPNATGCYGAAESASVTIRNFGSTPIDFNATNATVGVRVTGATAGIITTTLNSGTLAPGATQNVTVGNINMSAAGTYSFRGFTSIAGDTDASSDTTRATRTVAAIATLPQRMDFTGFTGSNLTTVFPNWKEAAGTNPAGTTSNWTSKSDLGATGNVTAKINLYTNSNKEWIVGPKITATATTSLRFNAAITDFNSTSADAAGMQGTDDKVQVMVSTNCGATYTPIYSFDASNTTTLTNVLTDQVISLAAYTGQNIIVAFYATDGTVDDAPDYDFHIDDVFLGTIPTIDLGVTAVVNPQVNACFGPAENVTVTIKNFSTTPLDFSTNNATVSVRTNGAIGSTISTTLNTGTLAPGATQNVSVGNLNMQTAGTYNFRAFTTIATDGFAGNDTARTSRTVAPTLALPQRLDFTGFTGSNLTTVFPNWKEAAGTTPAGTASNWTSSTGLGDAANVTAKINLYTNSNKEWIIGPKVTPTATTSLRFNVAITDFASLAADAAGMQGTDDKVQVMVSNDCGISFTPIYTFDASNTTTLTNVLTDQVISLAAYAGQNIIVAFYATDGTVDNAPDYDFHIDDIFIGTIPAIDLGATAVVNPSITGCFGATENVTVTIKNFSTTPLDFSTNNATVSVRTNGAIGSTISTTLNTGTLAPGATQNVSVGTLNMTAAGTYNFRAYTTIATDGFAGNDTARTSRTVTAPVALPQRVDFTGFTGSNLTTVFPNWKEATGAVTTTPSGTTSGWTSTTGLGSTSNVTAKINLYSTGKNEWIVGPKVTPTATTSLRFNAAITDFASLAADAAGMQGTDDKVQVMVSNDCGISFTPIYTFDASNTTTLTNVLTDQVISLAAYAGQNIIVAFYATDGTADNTPDYDFHIDDIFIGTVAPVDVQATALVSPVTAPGCYGNAQNVIVSVRNFGTTPLDFAANNATVTVNVTGAVTQTLTATINSNALNNGNPLPVMGSINVPVGTLNMLATGAYTFNANATATGDGNTANDAITPVIITVAPVVAGTASATGASVCLGNTTTLTLTGNTGGNIQWQEASAAAGPFTDITGATTATYATTTPINQPTFFRAAVSCGTTAVNSNVVTVNVTNPQIASTTPASRCGSGTVTLTAAASGAGTIKWYSTATGGVALATGNTYTPTVTATTTFYAEANEGGGTYNAGLTSTGSYGTYGSPGGTGYGLGFTVTQPGTLASAYVYPVSAGNVVVQLYTRAGVAVGSPVTVAVSTTDVGNKTLIPLNIAIPAAGNYNLVNTTGSVYLNRYNPYSGPAFPLNSAGNVLSLTGGVTSASATPDAGLYYSFFDVTFTNTCTSGRQAVIATVNPLPVVALGADRNVCGAASTTLDAGNAGFDFQWSLNGTPIAGATSQTLVATANGTYAVTVTNPTTICSATDDVIVNFFTAPAVPTVTAGGPTTFCAGGSVILTAASTTTGVTYAWFLDGNAITGATSATITANATGNYTVVSTSATGGCTATSTATTVTVNPLPTPTITGLNATYCQNAAAVTLTGTPTGSTFTIDGVAATSFNPATLTVGNHTVVVSSTNASNCTGTASQTVAVTATPTTPTVTAGGATTFCSGGSVALTAASTTTGATYQWSLNGTVINGANSATYTANAAGTYTVIADAGGCSSAISLPTTVTVNATPATPTITQNGGILTSSSATGNQWFLNSVAIPGATSQTYITAANGNYTVTVTANGCSATSTGTNVTTSGMSEALAGMSVQVYPNPANGSFNVKLEGYQKDAAVVLYNLAGQQIIADKVAADGNAKNINIKGLAAGTYLLKVTSDKGVQVSRLIVQ